MYNYLPLIIFCIFIVPFTSSASIDDRPTVNEVNRFNSVILERMKRLPSSESALIEEKRRVADDLSKVLSLIDSNSQNPEKSVLRKGDLVVLGDKIRVIQSDIRKINPKDIEGSKDMLKDISLKINQLNPPPLLQYKDYGEKWNEINAILQHVVNLTYEETITEPILVKLKVDYMKNFDLLVKKLVDDYNKSQKEKKKDKEDLLLSLEALKGSLASYNDKLNKELESFETKGRIQDNLHWMILTIGGLSIAAITVTKFFPNDIMMEWVASGQVIQFVTVMILLSVIMALGLAGLLSEDTLGTLLGGIGGYVLSQGVGRSATRRAELSFKKDNRVE